MYISSVSRAVLFGRGRSMKPLRMYVVESGKAVAMFGLDPFISKNDTPTK